MEQHPALKPGNVAVITGAADGIGFAAARKLSALGMRVCMADIDADKLSSASKEAGDVLAVPTDVSKLEDLQHLKEQVYAAYGPVDVLMNNAGTGRGTGSWTHYENWQTTLNVNLWGVINGVHTFVPDMVERGDAGLVINTGSKQGITCPPGDPAYNVSKAGIKAVTEALEHSLRNTEACRTSAHLLVPGFTYTGMVKRFLPDKPESAWTPEQVVDFMLVSINNGDFYILCPDNDVDRETDNKRMEWAMGDLIHNRPALSRWHADYETAFAEFLKK